MSQLCFVIGLYGILIVIIAIILGLGIVIGVVHGNLIENVIEKKTKKLIGQIKIKEREVVDK